MAKKWLAVGIAVLGFASAKINVATDGAVYASDARASHTHASDAAQLSADAQCVSTVPRSWGEYRGGSNQAGLAFEASDGTINTEVTMESHQGLLPYDSHERAAEFHAFTTHAHRVAIT